MMNLSMSHPVPTFGDSFTITCYVCGMPSSKEWAQKARSRPTTPMKPYFPFLLQITPVGGALLREDGSTYLCAFCHASLEAQWNVYETQQVVPPPNRKYNIQKFICAVCGVETYRKRIRALPFQEFPFLEKTRQAGSITLGNNPLAVVCLDCSETLWAQSAEYDRWGLPVQKRHFNWMARPPPPEDSVEATVARLPSGETQLPRCPPIEPSLVPKPDTMPGVKILDTAISAKARSKGKGDSPKLDSSHNLSPIPQMGRKTSMTSTTPPALDMVGGFHSQQPPVVTVAPMSSHTTVISLRKDSVGLPPGMISTASGATYPQLASAVYPPAAQYAPYVWTPTAASRESNSRSIEAYPYTSSSGSEAMHGPPGAWPWLPHPPADLIRYQTYVTSLQSRSISESTVSRSPTHSAGSSSAAYGASSSPPRYSSSTNVAIAGRSRERERSPIDDQRSSTLTSSRRGAASGGSSDDLTSTYPRRSSPDAKSGAKSPKAIALARDAGKPPTSERPPYPLHHKKLPKEAVATSSSSITAVQNAPVQKEDPPVVLRGSQDDDEQEKSNRREFHIPKKRNWHVFMKDSQSSQSVAQTQEKKVEEVTFHPKKKKSSLSFSEAVVSAEAEAKTTETKDDTGVNYPTPKKSNDAEDTVSAESAMDLSSASSRSCKSGGGKFMIEYLCQSESSSTSQLDDAAPRTSVIKCAPKVPLVQPEETSQKEDAEESVSTAETRSPVKEGNSEKEPTPGKASPKNVDDEKVMPLEDKVEDEEGGEKGDKVGETKEECKNEKKGNSENREQEDSTMHSDDDDERKNEDLPNLEQFIKETVLELVNREKEQERVKKEETQQQKQFLNELGLITPDKKIELEIKSIVSRHDRKTLPPLKLRVDTKIGRKIDKKLKELLLKVSLEDPSLFQEKPESEKCDFMAELGMKTAKKSEKTKREIKWRVVLMERMRRELRDATARGIKHEWEKAEILKKFADCDLDSFFSSLSFASLLSPDEDLDKEDTVDTDKDDKVKEENRGKRVCINYPKYIPSYAVPNSDTETTIMKVEEENACTNGDESSGTNGNEASLAEPILKIPVIPPKRHLHSESSSVTTAASDTDDSIDVGNNDDDSKNLPASVPSTSATTGSIVIDAASTEPYPLRIDSLIQCSASYWEQMKRGIDDILNDLESTKEDVPTEEKTIQIEKICKHLKSQLSDIKNIEKKLRATGKTILSANRRKNLRKSE